MKRGEGRTEDVDRDDDRDEDDRDDDDDGVQTFLPSPVPSHFLTFAPLSSSLSVRILIRNDERFDGRKMQRMEANDERPEVVREEASIVPNANMDEECAVTLLLLTDDDDGAMFGDGYTE